MESNLNLYYIFYTVAECKNISAAAKELYISQPAISKAIIEEVHRGGTILPAKGAFSGDPREVLLCAIRNHQFYKIKRIVNLVDPKAFIIVTNAGEVLGEGFKKIEG